MSLAHIEAFEAEKSVLGSIMLDNAAKDRVASLTADDFADARHAIIYAQMVAMDGPVDAITLQAAMEKAGTLDDAGGFDHLMDLSDASGSAINVVHHAQIVADASRVRALMAGAQAIYQQASTGDFDDVDTLVADAAESMVGMTLAASGRRMMKGNAALTAALLEIQAAGENDGAMTGITTGFELLDKRTSGLQGGDMIVIAARPGMGKTALAVNFMTAAARNGDITAAFFTLEMQNKRLARRMLASEARVDSNNLKTGVLSDGDVERLLMTVKRLSAMHMHFDDTPGASISHVRAECRQLAADKSTPPLGLVVIDYMQLMRGNAKGGREQEVAGISRAIKEMAKELDVPVLVLAQLNRGVEARQDKRPLLSDLRESGAIEQDADIVMFVYRDDYYNDESEEKGIAEIIFAKFREGETGTDKLKWFGKWTRFDDLPTGGF